MYREGHVVRQDNIAGLRVVEAHGANERPDVCLCHEDSGVGAHLLVVASPDALDGLLRSVGVGGLYDEAVVGP